MGHTYSVLFTHLIFSTKDRIPYLTKTARDEIFGYMAGIAVELGAKEVTINGEREHVHALLKLPPSLAVASAVNKLKANSTKWAHQTRLLPGAFAWQIGYAAFSVSPSSVAKTRRYVENQELHHRKRSFQEEYVAFLKVHGIEYDKRFVWD